MASEQMRSRAGASMAYALGLTTFIARNLDDYQAVALRLASSRPRLRAARRRMEAAIESEPFFDTPLWAKVCLACSRLRIDCPSRFAARLFPSHRESLIETARPGLLWSLSFFNSRSALFAITPASLTTKP